MTIVYRKRSRHKERKEPPSTPVPGPAPGESKGAFAKRLRLDMNSPLWPWKCPDCGRNIGQKSKKCGDCSGSNMTSEKRSKHALCDAKKANGQRCRAFAGQGTSHPGRGHCKHHGGSLPVQEAAVARREVLEMVRAEGPMEDVTPEQAVMWMLRLTAGRANSLERASREEEGVRADVLAVIRDQVFDRLLKISAVAMQYGLTDHEIRVEQQQATFVLWAIDSALGDAGLGNRERNIIGAFIRKLMAEQAEDVDALAAATARLEDLRNEGVADAEVVEEPGD